MAKTSQINRNKKREKMVAQYAQKRAALKAKAENMNTPAEGLLSQAQAVAHCAARSREFRSDPRHDQGQLVRKET